MEDISMKYSNGKVSGSLEEINGMIGLLVRIMRNQGSDERDVQNCVRSIYEQFEVPEEKWELLKKTGTIDWYDEKRGRGFIDGDDDECLRFFKESIAGDDNVPPLSGEIVSYIQDGNEARYIENCQHHAPEENGGEDEDEVLHYHEIEDDKELDVLNGCALLMRGRDSFELSGEGMDLTFKEGNGGVRMINLFIPDDGGMYLSDWY
ncbi:hypothetical protein LK537_25540 [Lachnoclostridium pacaense]|uniref:cold-shock protein n=1 Tax=Enterocloster hominis (ex Hitch et al. 2024) TaxID=1917870 RepID=UPI001D0F7A7D|nr:hypothetical protein [Lachnoclostridium pacaense]MCC2820676.1 hypothetical protein [Lachnoclostridium pacaense]